MEEEALKLMEEMNRFEAEIATEVPMRELPDTPRHIIGVNTFQAVQKKLSDDSRPKGDGPIIAPPVVCPPPPPPSQMPPIFAPPISGIFPNIPPPPPPPPFMIPHQVRGQRLLPPLARLPPPPPPLASINLAPPKPGPVVLSAAPTKYKAPSKKSRVDDQVSEFLKELKEAEQIGQVDNFKPEKSIAKVMAEQVKANTVVLVQPVNSDAGADDFNGASGQSSKPKKEKKSKKIVRMAGGQSWEDPSLLEWEDDDFRIFCGDLGNDVTDEILTRAFSKYSSFLKAKVVRDKRTNKTKGFGFVSFKDPQDFIKAMKEMNGRYVGSRPIKLRKSSWKQRSLDIVKKKDKEKATLISILTGR